MRATAAAIRASPAVAGARGDTRSAKVPASGAATMMATGMTSITAPARPALSPRWSWR